jgi:hypothetical protein
MNCRKNVDIEIMISVAVKEGRKYYENIHAFKLKYKFRKRSVIIVYDMYNFTFGHVNFDKLSTSVKFL